MFEVLLQTTVDAGTWPWIVAALAGVITALSGLYNKVQMDRIKSLEAERVKLQDEVRELWRQRAESEGQVVALLEKTTDVLEKLTA